MNYLSIKKELNKYAGFKATEEYGFLSIKTDTKEFALALNEQGFISWNELEGGANCLAGISKTNIPESIAKDFYRFYIANK